MTDEQRLQMITDQLILVRDNLFRGMSKSIQKLQARSINEVLELETFIRSAPDLQSELDATNRQVEILSDALAESRREVDAMIALARADERDKWMERAHIMILGEREACAKVCDELHWTWHMGDNSGPKECAAVIRARGNT
jgi:hypothetical protein